MSHNLTTTLVITVVPWVSRDLSPDRDRVSEMARDLLGLSQRRGFAFPPLQGSEQGGAHVMIDLPRQVAAYIHANLFDARTPAYFLVDETGCVRESGGRPAFYGVTELICGRRLHEQLFCLEGLLPLLGGSMCLQWIELQPGRYADLHLFASVGGAWVLLLDATSEAIRHGQMQQKLNDISLGIKSELS